MACQEKEELQRRCTAASERLDAVAQEVEAATGILFDFRSMRITCGRPRGLKNRRVELSRVWKARARQLRASMELSRHLSKHRC